MNSNMIMMLLIAGAGVYFFTKKTPAVVTTDPNTGTGSGMPTPRSGWFNMVTTWIGAASGNSGSIGQQSTWCSAETFGTQVSFMSGLPTGKAYQAGFQIYPEVKRYVQLNGSWPPASTVDQWLAEAWATIA